MGTRLDSSSVRLGLASAVNHAPITNAIASIRHVTTVFMVLYDFACRQRKDGMEDRDGIVETPPHLVCGEAKSRVMSEI